MVTAAMKLKDTFSLEESYDKPKVKVAMSCPTLTAWTIQSMEFSRPEYRSGYPFPSGESSQLRDQTQVFHTAGRFFTS